MARQVESIPEVDSPKIKKPSLKDIAEYFLTTQESALTRQALKIYQYRNTIDFVSLIGDEFFCDLFSNLLDVWDVKTLDDKKKFAPSAGVHSVSLPGVLERRDDLPRIISFFIESYIEKSRRESNDEDNIPESVGLLMLGSLLSYPGWKDFNHLRRFIEQSITICTAKVVTRDQSISKLEHLFTPSETVRKELGIANKVWSDVPRTERITAIHIESAMENWLSSVFVEWYSCVCLKDEDHSTEFHVRLDRTYFAMKNLIEIDGLYPDIRVRSVNRTREDLKISKCFGKRWYNYSKDMSIESIEKRVSTALKYKDFERYIRWTDNKNINLLFRESDTVYPVWDKARTALGIRSDKIQEVKAEIYSPELKLIVDWDKLQFCCKGSKFRFSENIRVCLRHFKVAGSYGVTFEDVKDKLTGNPGRLSDVFKSSNAGKYLWKNVVDYTNIKAVRLKPGVRLLNTRTSGDIKQ